MVYPQHRLVELVINTGWLSWNHQLNQLVLPRTGSPFRSLVKTFPSLSLLKQSRQDPVIGWQEVSPSQSHTTQSRKPSGKGMSTANRPQGPTRRSFKAFSFPVLLLAGPSPPSSQPYLNRPPSSPIGRLTVGASLSFCFSNHGDEPFVFFSCVFVACVSSLQCSCLSSSKARSVAAYRHHRYGCCECVWYRS